MITVGEILGDFDYDFVVRVRVRGHSKIEVMMRRRGRQQPSDHRRPCSLAGD